MAGDTIQTASQRFTEYSDMKGGLVARMRYDHLRDPDENVNLSELLEGAEITEQLTERLRSGKGKDEDLPRL